MSTWDINKINLKDKDYPSLLREIYDPPKQLYVAGNLLVKEKLPIAVVGTRKMSDYGRETTEKFVTFLAQNQFTIISGLARGIDGLSHQIALDYQAKTIAVLGSGINQLYPPEHLALAKKIVGSNGAVISEYEPETKPSQRTFPARNRIIAGLSLAVLVIEAPKKSGALITAQVALDQGRDVLVIPGNVNRPNSVGCNKLIQQGAKLITKPKEILENLNLQLSLT